MEAAAIEWFDREMAALKEEKRHEAKERARCRRLAKEINDKAPDLAALLRLQSMPEHLIASIREAILDLIRDTMAADLPGALAALGVPIRRGAR